MASDRRRPEPSRITSVGVAAATRETRLRAVTSGCTAAAPVKRCSQHASCANPPKFTGTGSPTPCGPCQGRPACRTSSMRARRTPVRHQQYMQEYCDGMPQPRQEAAYRIAPASRPIIESRTSSAAYFSSMIQPDSIWRLRANSSSRRDRAPGYQDTNSSQIATPSGRVSRTTFPIRIPANNATARRKAECAINVCMPLIPGCPCATADRA